VFTFANFLAGPIVEIIGPRWALCIGTFGYTLFLVGFHFLNSYYLYFSAALLGLCAAGRFTTKRRKIQGLFDFQSLGLDMEII
jgi:MFS family permease